MDYTLLLNAPFEVQIHITAALSAVVLTPLILMRRKGDRAHRIVGRLWVLTMALTALSSFAIHGIRMFWHFSPIHILSAFTLYTLGAAILAARAGKINKHKQSMFGAMAGLFAAGLFTVLPGRLMSQVLFKGVEVEGFIASLLAGGLALTAWHMSKRRKVIASN